MTHVVFIVGSFYPNYSAVAYCAAQVIRELKDEFQISVIAIRHSPDLPYHEIVDGIDVFRVDAADVARRLNLSRLITSAAGKRTRLNLLWWRAWAVAKKLLSPVTVDRQLVEAYRTGLESLGQVDAIVPLVFPFESAIAGLEYVRKNPATQLIPYIFDRFVESRSLHVFPLNRWFKRRKHLALELEMFEQAIAVVAMHPLKEHFCRHFPALSRTKLVCVEHPLLVPARANVCRSDGITRLVFTGSLIRHVVEAEYLMTLLVGLLPKAPIEAAFYVMGNAAHQVVTASPSRFFSIRNHGRVPKEVAQEAVAQADILLNIGEMQGRQISSKVFEYMAAGKPIVHLACVCDDVMSELLSRYPLALCLQQSASRLEENRQSLVSFIERFAKRRLAFDEVAALYPEALPVATANLMRRLIVDGFADPSGSDAVGDRAGTLRQGSASETTETL